MKTTPTTLGAGDTILLHNARGESKRVKITRVHTGPGDVIKVDTPSGRIVITKVNGEWPMVDVVPNPNSAGARGPWFSWDDIRR